MEASHRPWGEDHPPTSPAKNLIAEELARAAATFAFADQVVPVIVISPRSLASWKAAAGSSDS